MMKVPAEVSITACLPRIEAGGTGAVKNFCAGAAWNAASAASNVSRISMVFWPPAILHVSKSTCARGPFRRSVLGVPGRQSFILWRYLVRRQLIGTGFVAVALVAALASPAFAQDKPGDVAVGLSILGDNGGVGLQGSLSNKIKDLANDKILSWVADVSFHHNSILDVGFTTFFVQGGARVGGPINDKTDWFGQGLIGIVRRSCCGVSDTAVVITPGGGIDYAINEKMKVRGQLDIPISLEGDGGSTTRFFIGLVWPR